MKVKILSNGVTYDAKVCDNTNIASIKVGGIVYKFSKHEYEIIGEEK